MAGDHRAHRVAFQAIKLQKWQLLNVLQPGLQIRTVVRGRAVCVPCTPVCNSENSEEL